MMNQPLLYETDILREKSMEPPILLDGEQIICEGKFGIAPSTYIGALIACFFPPLFILWGMLLLGLVFFLQKHGSRTLWLTNKRIVESHKLAAFKSSFQNVSIPLTEIKSLKRNSEGVLGFLDRLFGIADLGVFVNVSKNIGWKSHVIGDVKNWKEFVKTFKTVSSAPVENE